MEAAVRKNNPPLPELGALQGDIFKRGGRGSGIRVVFWRYRRPGPGQRPSPSSPPMSRFGASNCAV